MYSNRDPEQDRKIENIRHNRVPDPDSQIYIRNDWDPDQEKAIFKHKAYIKDQARKTLLISTSPNVCL